MECYANRKRRVTWGGAIFGVVLLWSAAPLSASPIYRSIDGTGNNPIMANDLWGAAGTQLLRGKYDGRSSTAAYGDGVSSLAGPTRPSARSVSNGVSAQSGSDLNKKGATDMLWQWGQFLDHDIDLTPEHNPHEAAPIPVPSGDPFFDPFHTGTQEISLTRSVYDTATGTGANNPRQQLNQITSFIDASNVYGSDAVRAAALRTNDGTGKLKTSPGDLLPFNTAGLPNAGGPSPTLFLAGDVRANEQVGLIALHTLFVREHNRLATEIKADNPGFNGEKVYQEARKLVGAMMQNITYNEFLPMLLGSSAPGAYTGYDQTVNPNISNEFSTAAYRLGHSMLSSEIMRLDANGDVIGAGNISLKDAFFRPSEVINNGGIEPLLRGLSSQYSQNIDPLVIDDVRNFLFGPPGSGGLDLASLNIQRGRDHGLMGYNDMRAIVLGVEKYTGWSDPTLNFLPGVKEALMAVYDSIDDVDLWIGGLSEAHAGDSMVGELFTAILRDQFERLRVENRYWYENNMFEQEWMDVILESSLSNIIIRNTGIEIMQSDAFHISEPGPLALFGLAATVLLASRRRAANRP